LQSACKTSASASKTLAWLFTTHLVCGEPEATCQYRTTTCLGSLLSLVHAAHCQSFERQWSLYCWLCVSKSKCCARCTECQLVDRQSNKYMHAAMQSMWQTKWCVLLSHVQRLLCRAPCAGRCANRRGPVQDASMMLAEGVCRQLLKVRSWCTAGRQSAAGPAPPCDWAAAVVDELNACVGRSLQRWAWSKHRSEGRCQCPNWL
jgi:hypothetical protein